MLNQWRIRFLRTWISGISSISSWGSPFTSPAPSSPSSSLGRFIEERGVAVSSGSGSPSSDGVKDGKGEALREPSPSSGLASASTEGDLR